MKIKSLSGRISFMVLLIALIALCVYSLWAYSCYQQGLSAMDSYNFIVAQRYFEKLPFKDSLLADEYAYIQAGVLMDQGHYLEALKAFDDLDGLPVPVSVVEKLSKKISLEEDPYEALIAAGELRKLKLPSASVSTLKNQVYIKGQNAYKKGDLDAAIIYFRVLGDFKRTKDYYFLISFKNNLSGSSRGNNYDKFISLIGFEDASTLLLENESYTKRFLCGRWEEAETWNYFELDSEYSARYNLPYTYNAAKHYYLERGIYSTGNEASTAIDQFEIEIIDTRTIKIFCYKDSSTHILHRK